MNATTRFDLRSIGGRSRFDDLVSAVVQAGDQALAMQASVQVERKPDDSPVTDADRETERGLRNHIEHNFPGVGFFGEETGGDTTGGLRFLVDPIDGTRAFARGLATWSVLVGLELDGVPVAGIAYLPAAGQLFVGVCGGGATLNGRPVQLSTVDRLDHALVCHGGLAQFTEAGRGELLPALAKSTYTQRGLGDFAGYAALLQGQADAVIDPGTSAYDVAPAAVLVREAGGTFTDLTGAPTIHGDGALASNGRLHSQLLQLITTE